MPALVLVALALAQPAPAAAQQQPREESTDAVTCIEEVDGGRFDDSVDLAGRVRSFASEDGDIVTRSLHCPYVDEDGRVTELVLEWDDVPLDRFRCNRLALTLEDTDPTRGRLDHVDRQASVVLTGPDEAAVRAMETAAHLALDAVPEGAASCAEDSSVADEGGSATADRTVGTLLAVAILVALTALVVRWRRGRRTLAAEPVRTSPEVLARHLLARVESGPIDALAAAAAVAHGRDRPDLVELAVRGRTELVASRFEDPTGPGVRLAGQILDTAVPPADGAADDNRAQDQDDSAPTRLLSSAAE